MSDYHALRFLNIAHFIDHFFILIFPTAVLALHLAWDMSYGEAIALGSPAFILFAAATLPCGWLGDRFGGVVMMRVFFVGMGLSCMAVGLARTPFEIMAALGALGLFAAIYHPVATAMVVTLAGDRRGRELGINGVWGNLGVALAAAVTGAIAAWLSWRAAFLLPGAISLALGVAYWQLSRRRDGAATPAAARRQPPIDPADQRRVFVVIAVAALCGGLIFAGVTIAMPRLMQERLDASALGLIGIGGVTTLVFVAASFTQLLTGRLLDRVGPKPIMLVAAGAQVPLLVAVALMAGAGVVPLAIALMLMVFGEIPVTSWLLAQYVTAEWRSRAFAIQFLLALGVHAAIVPLIAWLHERSGDMTSLFLVMAAAAAPVFLVAFLIPGERRHGGFALRRQPI